MPVVVILVCVLWVTSDAAPAPRPPYLHGASYRFLMHWSDTCRCMDFYFRAVNKGVSAMTVSASGLFRAMGKKAKIAPVLLDGEIVQSNKRQREKNEFYPTPPEPTRALIHAELTRLRDFNMIWEPAAGNGAMVRELRTVGLNVYASDLIDRGCDAEIQDFYDYSTPPSKAIFTNPPFIDCGWGTPAIHALGKGKAQWLYHALDRLEVEYMALLLNWSWPGAGGLDVFWSQFPPARVYLMRWKVDFTGQGAPPILNAWFVWDKEHRGETVLRMLDRKDARQGELFNSEAAE